MANWPEPTEDQPPLDELIEEMDSNGTCEATDGCIVEPDGICEHNHPSWLRKLGLI